MPGSGNPRSRYGVRKYQRRGYTRPFDRYRSRAVETARNRPGYSSVARTRGWVAAGEMKYFDTELDETVITASTNWSSTEYDPATLNTLFCPTKGTGINNRVGRKVKVYKVKVRGFIWVAQEVNETQPDDGVMVRLALVHDKQTNSAQCQGEQVFRDPTTADAKVAVQAFQSLDNLGRFKVLRDRYFRLPTRQYVYDGTNIEKEGIVVPFKFNVHYRHGIVVNFNATDGGTVADIVDNSWHVLCNISDADMVPNITYTARVAYKDM